MYSSDFDYYRPESLEEAIALLQEKESAKIIAGGHSLLPAMKLQLSQQSALVDIGQIPGLSAIQASNGNLTIGAMTSHATIAASDEVKRLFPILAETAAQIGDRQVRNRGTLGGSLAHADPAADYPAVVMALNATLTAISQEGSREIPVEHFFTDLLTTVLKPAEVLTSVQIPAMKPGSGSAYLKHRHPASSYAVVGVAAIVHLTAGQITDASLVVGGATVNPTRCTAAENALKGQTADKRTVAGAAKMVTNALSEPLNDVYASGEYRVHLASVMAQRALNKAIERAQS